MLDTVLPDIFASGTRNKPARGNSKAEKKTAPRNSVKAEREKELDERSLPSIDNLD